MYRVVCPEGSKINVLGGYGVEALCPGGDMILVISRGVQLYYGIAHCVVRF